MLFRQRKTSIKMGGRKKDWQTLGKK